MSSVNGFDLRSLSYEEVCRSNRSSEIARAASMEFKRRGEHRNIIQAPGEGCSFCVDGAKSDSTAEQIDMCRQKLGYLPIYMRIEDQRPTWCPGFERNGDGMATKPIANVNETEHQEELPL